MSTNFGVTPVAESIPFSDPTYTSKNLKEAVVEAGLKNSSGSGGQDNFSYNVVTNTSTVIVPINQQMIVKRRLKVEGRLIIRGQVCLI